MRVERVIEEREALRVQIAALAQEAAELGPPPARVGREEVDQINILARWISHHSEDDERAFFRLPSDLRDAEALAAFVDRVAAAAAGLRAQLAELARLAALAEEDDGATEMDDRMDDR